jgi:CRP-like cAMP-binding protein
MKFKNTHKMLDWFKDNFPLLEDKWDEYASYYHRVEVPAKTILFKEGEVPQKAFMIEKGCLRVWFNNKGKDVTFQFFFENDVFPGAESLRKNIPSLFTIETIETTILHWINKKDLDKMMSDMNDIPEIRNKIADIAFKKQLNYIKHLLSFNKDTPEQRYLDLLKEKPDIIKRVPQKHIATYLGITPVSLSRIRNRLAK